MVRKDAPICGTRGIDGGEGGSGIEMVGEGAVVLGTLVCGMPSQTVGGAEGKAVGKADSLGLICLTSARW